MNEAIIPSKKSLLEKLSPKPLQAMTRKIVFGLLKHIEAGILTIEEKGRTLRFGQVTHTFPLKAEVSIHDPRFYLYAAFGGSVGIAEAYMLGYWSVDDLTGLIRIVIRNRKAFRGMDKGFARLISPAYRLYHAMRKNTLKGSRKNIVAHYDLGNDFYALFLDKTLTYSSGIFETPESTLREASVAKYDRICKKLRVGPEDHLLEIGTGWGGFAIHAVQNYGCRVTTTTISDAQYRLARERFETAGVADRITLLKSDYRDLEGQYDKLVSIEMIEAVGHHYLETFFRCCAERLKPEGMMLIQAITIADQEYAQHKREVDFIKRYIFPGSCLPSIAAISDAVARGTDLKLFHLEDITPHYAQTLRLWRERFFRNIEKVRQMGYSEGFIRMWEYYLTYCEAGFTERYIGDGQLIFTKPLCRTAPILGQVA